MWKRDEAVKPTLRPARDNAGTDARSRRLPTRRGRTVPRSEPQRGMERDIVNIGKSVVIKGELNGSEDLTIEGQVEGKIELRQNVLTIGPNGKIKAQVFAKAVIVLGEVTGNVTASEKVDIRDNGSVDGDIVVAARGDCRGRALPRQRRHAAQGREREAGREGGPEGGRQACRRGQAAGTAAASTSTTGAAAGASDNGLGATVRSGRA